MSLDIIGRVAGGEDLSMDDAAQAIDGIMQGKWSDSDIALLLTGLNAKGPTVNEIAGAALAMRANMKRINSRHTEFIDTCGTGGSGAGTFNISTAAAIVTAAAGVPVAKHGNRSVTSKTGSADVLAALGVNVEASVPQVETCLDQLSICFCFAPLMHRSMKHVANVRKELGVPTIFNMLGPLCNPAGAPYQLLGVSKEPLRSLLAQALIRLGTKRSLVVLGEDGLDEVSLSGKTNVSEATKKQVTESSLTPEDFGLTRSTNESMLVETPEESARLINRILDGEPGPPRDIVVLNAAAALWTVGKSESKERCAQMAQMAIDSGAARDKLASLIQLTND